MTIPLSIIIGTACRCSVYGWITSGCVLASLIIKRSSDSSESKKKKYICKYIFRTIS